MRISIPVSEIELDEGGHTLWVQSPKGATVLRIKTIDGEIITRRNCENICSHADLIVKGDIEVCLAGDQLGPNPLTLLRRLANNISEYITARDEAEDESEDEGEDESVEQDRVDFMIEKYNQLLATLKEVRRVTEP